MRAPITGSGDDMRRHDLDDEVDLVVVGAGAGGGGADPAPGPGRLAGRRAWTPGPSGTPTATGSATSAGRTACTGPSPGRSAAPTPCRWAATTPAAASAARWSTTPATRRASTRRTSATYSEDGVGADWPISYADLRPYYEAIEAELPVSGQDWPWGDPHSYPYSPHPVGGNGDIFLRGARAAGIEARVGPVAIANGRFGNRPHCIYRGFCLQGCKVNAKASPLITHVPDALAHGAEIRPDSHVSRVLVGRRHRPGHRRDLPAPGPRVPPACPGRRGRRLQHRDARGCCCSRRRRAFPTASATTTTRSAAT